MENAHLLRSRSGISSLPRRSISGGASPEPFSPNSSPVLRRSPGGAVLARSKSAAKDRFTVSADTSADASSSSSPSASAFRRSSKENRTNLSPRFPPPDPAGTPRKPKLTSPSAWALSPGRSLPRSVTAPPDVGGRRLKSVFVSPWARSTVRSPSPQTADTLGTATSAAAMSPIATARKKGGAGGSGGGVLGLFRRRKEAPAREEELHQLRMLTSRLAQWRFANARAEAAMGAAGCNAEEKIFCVWLKIYELRNLVAAKRILVQRRRHKTKLLQILDPQVQLLSQWEPHAKKHIEAVATLARLFGAACLSLPLVEGAQVNMVSLHRCMAMAMDIMKDIATTITIFYSTVADIDSMLPELVKTIRMEIQGLEELMKLSEGITTLEIHEISLRAHLIQGLKEEDELPPFPHQWSANGTNGFRSIKLSSWS